MRQLITRFSGQPRTPTYSTLASWMRYRSLENPKWLLTDPHEDQRSQRIRISMFYAIYSNKDVTTCKAWCEEP